MNPLARSILRQQPVNPVRLAYGVMASATTVNIEGDATAVEVPQLLSAGRLVSGDYVAIQIVGADALIIGKVGTATGWTTFTPSWTNLTPGNATTDFRYRYMTPTDMHVRGEFTFGSTTSITGSVSMTIPNSRTQSGVRNIGWGWFQDVTGPDFTGTCQASGTGIFVHNDAISDVTATVPYTWATGDLLSLDIIIELVAV